MLISLPSRFTGGATLASHGVISNVHNSSINSHYQTSVTAWYTGAMLEVQPITSGYHLALSYSLIHTTATPRPALSANDPIVAKLRAALSAWKADVGRTTPRMILYLLKGHYSAGDLRGGSLHDEDAQHLAWLKALSKELGFRMGLASVECSESGPADDKIDSPDRDYPDYWGYGRDEDESKDEEASVVASEDVEFEEVEEEGMEVTGLIDFDGQEIADELDIDDSQDIETIPESLHDGITCRGHYEQKYHRAASASTQCAHIHLLR